MKHFMILGVLSGLGFGLPGWFADSESNSLSGTPELFSSSELLC